MSSYDLAIIGSGPGGYVAAIYAARHNLKVCVIEKDRLGGTCLNKGCIPAKSLLNSVSIIPKLNKISDYGISLNGYTVDFGRIASRKDEVVLKLRNGIATLLKANGVDVVNGAAKLKSSDVISVTGSEDIRANNVIIATGSRPAGLPGIAPDNEYIMTSENIMDIRDIPRSLIIVGGGAIGCEFAGLFNKLGTDVTIVEAADRIMPMQSREVSRRLDMSLKKCGITVMTGATVESAAIKDGVVFNISGGRSLSAEKALVSVGRISNIEGIGLEEAGISVRDGRVSVNGQLLTDIPGIYAIGDCVPGPQLAHKASYDGILACDNILGSQRRADYSCVPNCVWTDPEIASVGMTEEAARASARDVRIAKFPYLASGKACLEAETEGFVKIAATASGAILGVEIFGKDACNLIGEAALAMSTRVTVGEWGKVVHGHPTLSEIFPEACHVFTGTPIHVL